MTTTLPSADDLLAHLHQQGIDLWLEGDRLRYSAPKGAMTDDLRQQLKQHRAELIAAVQQASSRPPAASAAPSSSDLYPVSRDEPLPLSFLQLRLWFLERLTPGNPAYTINAAFRLVGSLHLETLEASLHRLLHRHEALRTRVAPPHAPDQHQPTALVDPPPAPAESLVALVDMQHLPAAEREAAAIEQATAAARQPFDLTRDRLLRVVLYRLEPTRHILLLLTHHFAADGWSMGILGYELLHGLNACREPLPVLPIQYADYAAWQRRLLDSGALREQLAYWQQQLANLPPMLSLPTDYPRPPVQRFAGATATRLLPPTLTAALKGLSRQERVTLFALLLAAYHTLLYRYSGQTDMLIATAVSSRSRAESENVIGPFSNNLLLRATLDDPASHDSVDEQVPTFRHLLARTHQTVVAAQAHQDVPFDQLVAHLHPQRSLSHNPLFQTLFVLQNPPPPPVELANLAVDVLAIDNQTSKFDLTLSAQETPAGLALLAEYSSDLFVPATIERLLSHYTTLLEHIAAHPDTPLDRVALLAPLERQQVLYEWSSTADTNLLQQQTEPPPFVHDLLSEQATRTPHTTALEYADADEPHRLSYAELEQQASRLAQQLRSQGVGPEVVVGLCVERSPAMVIGLLAVLKAGGAYLPLDPDYPPERLRFMLADARPPLLLSRPHLLARLGVPVAVQPAGSGGLLLAHNLAAPTPPASDQPLTPDNLAYVIYTSGSTGQPRGVLVPHRGLPHLAASQIAAFGLRPGSRALQFAAFSFDASVSEILTTLLAGATLVLPPPEKLAGAALLRLLHEQAIHVVTLPPSVLATLPPTTDTPLPALHTLVVAGEACPPALAARWSRGRRVINAYGPSEATVCATMACYDDGLRMTGPAGETLPERLPIGRPAAHVRVYVLDQHMQPVPVGVAGELYIGGAGVARGYLHRPALTAERFLANPFGTGRLYRTGDRVRYRADGSLEFLGRRDQQIKLRGVRIEPGEIESALMQHPAIQSCLVLLREDTPGDPRLVAYLLAHPAAEPPAPPELRRLLAARLPDSMLPAAFVWLERWPLAPGGKVNRAALPAPVYGPQSKQADSAGAAAGDAATLETLGGIWRRVLGIDTLAPDDNFFDLGGHSLLAVRLIDEVNQQFGQRLPLTTLFQGGTLRQMAHAMQDTAEDAPDLPPLLVLLKTGQTGSDTPPLFCVHPVMGVVFPYATLARHLPADLPLYGIQAAGLADEQPPHTSIEAMATAYIQAIQQVQPAGPYYLGGWSFGSLVAYEMARQLAQQGQRTARLLIIDTPAPLPDSQPDRATLLLFGLAMLRLNLRHIWPYVGDYFNLRRQQTHPAIAALWRIFRANMQAALHYRPGSYQGQLTLLSTETGNGHSALQGWERLAADVTLARVPGNHLTLLREPYAAHLAAAIRDSLQSNHQGGG